MQLRWKPIAPMRKEETTTVLTATRGWKYRPHKGR